MSNRSGERPRRPSSVVVAWLLGISLWGSCAAASSGISEAQVRFDLERVVAMTAGSLTEIDSVEILGTESPFEGRRYVDLTVDFAANEAAIANSLAEQQRQQRLFGPAYRGRITDRELMMAREADGATERVRLTYRRAGGERWTLEDFGPVPSEYALERDRGGIGPAESEVREDFAEMFDLVSRGSLSLSAFEIRGSEVLSDDRVQLQVFFRFKGDASFGGNAEMAEEAHGKTNEVDVVYARGDGDRWTME